MHVFSIDFAASIWHNIAAFLTHELYCEVYSAQCYHANRKQRPHGFLGT